MMTGCHQPLQLSYRQATQHSGATCVQISINFFISGWLIIIMTYLMENQAKQFE